MTLNITYPDLPITAEKERIIELIQASQVIVIAGDTGSGKTTQLPKMCLEAGLGSKKIIGCTQPRRIAATTVAARVQEELGSRGRELVGWKIRFRNQTTRKTRIKFMTDGVLLAEAQHDPLLRAYEIIIIDEAHERSLNIDFLLGILARLLANRPDLKLIITSATIDTAKFSAAFNNAPVLEIPGRTFPVEIRYLADDQTLLDDSSYIDQAITAVMELRQNEVPGDILVFMPTERDIRETVDILNKKLRLPEACFGSGPTPEVMPLFGRLSTADQQRIFRRKKGRKIVVATNVAETSVTVPGIRYVVDTGLARILSYNVRAGTTKLPVTGISRSSCDQRAGRCGRLGPGVCVRLFSEENYQNRPDFTLPEILRANLAEVILRMAYLRLGNPLKFPFVDPPKHRAINDGYKLLTELGAINSKRKLTPRGRLMARLPLDPRISRMIIAAGERNALREVCIIAAALSIQDPRMRPADREKEADEAHGRFLSEESDFLTFVNLWQLYQQTLGKVKSQAKMRKFCKTHFLAYQRMREWGDIHEQIISILDENSIRRGRGKKKARSFIFNDIPAPDEAVHQAVLAGNLRHIAQKKKGNLYQGARQREMTIFPGSTLFNRGSQWLMAAELVETSRLYARCLAPIKVEWLEPLAGTLCRSSYSSPHWQKKEGRVVALEKVTLFGLVIVSGRRVNYGRINRQEAREIFIQSALVAGEYGGRLPSFLKHNLKLINSLEAMEDRLRCRDIMVDDYALFDFYDKRLSAEVSDRNSLNRFLSRNDCSLQMTEEDLLTRSIVDDRLEDFPQTITCREVILKLQYNFAPGSDDDGVSVIIPVDLLSHLRAEFFEWLVPGLLEEKIIFLLKGLPKSVRRQLIPIPRTAKELLADLVPWRGSLYRALETAIYDSYRLRIDPGQWPREIPPHLRMRFLLRDQEKNLAVTRNFVELSQAEAGRESRELGSLRRKWEKGGLSSWDFNGLEETIAIRGKNGELRGYGYPGLEKEENNTAAIRIFADPDERQIEGSQGLVALYSSHFSRQLKQLKKDLIIPRSQWPLYEGIGGHEKINDDIYDFILIEVFSCREGIIPDEQVFLEKISWLRENLYQEARTLFAEIMTVLRKRRELLDYISRVEDKVRVGKRFIISLDELSCFRQQAADIVPPDFLKKMIRRKILRLPAYLDALRIRLERRLVDPARDLAKEARARPFVELAEKVDSDRLTSEQRQLLAGYEEMLAEFRISVFAPELKTAFSVSEKKLKKKWREVELGCIHKNIHH
jgi:ATP-dependent helicase HrpA